MAGRILVVEDSATDAKWVVVPVDEQLPGYMPTLLSACMIALTVGASSAIFSRLLR